MHSAEGLHAEDDFPLSSFSNPLLTQACCTDCTNMTRGSIVSISMKQIITRLDLIYVIKNLFHAKMCMSTFILSCVFVLTRVDLL